MCSRNGFSLTIKTDQGSSSGLLGPLFGFGSKVKAVTTVLAGHRYVTLPHKTEYSIHLCNNRSTKCNAKVWIDRKYMGTWRIPALSSIDIERPVDKSRRFIFLKESSRSARRIGISSGDWKNGLVQVKFIPEPERRMLYGEIRPTVMVSDCGSGDTRYEYRYRPPCSNGDVRQKLMSMSAPASMLMESRPECYSGGATGLGRKSHQEFVAAESMIGKDRRNITVLSVRLITGLGPRPIGVPPPPPIRWIHSCQDCHYHYRDSSRHRSRSSIIPL